MNKNFKSREDYIEVLNEMTAVMKKYFSKGCARCSIGATGVKGYSKRVIGLETFARLLWGIVPLTASGEKSELTEIYIEGIKNGSNPAHEEYWGKGSSCDQMFVEMAALALGLLISPKTIWEPLNDEEKENFNNWLLQINDYPLPVNNWQFFKVLVNLGLKRVGGKYSEEQIENTLDLLDTMYLSDGWYSDGISDQRDYYIAFAMHFYSLIYAAVMKMDDPQRSKKYIERSKLFAKDYIYFFNEDGKALPFGRSLTYRFAQCAFFGALAFAGEYVYSWGVVKGIICRHFRWWFNQNIFDFENKLTLGYSYPNLIMCEGYNSPGSPYWAFKSFLILALDKEHPFWTAEEEPLPKLSEFKSLPHAYMLIDRRDANNVTAYTTGQFARWKPAHFDAKYEKFAYSSYFGFSVPKANGTIEQCAPDSMLAFEDGGNIFVRKKSDKTEIGENYIYSEWTPMRGVKVKTRIEPYGEGHIREHEIDAEFDTVAYECGFSLPTDENNSVRKSVSKNIAEAENEFGKVSIELLRGNGEGEYIENEANTNLMHCRTAMCCIRMDIKKGKTKIKSYIYGKGAKQ